MLCSFAYFFFFQTLFLCSTLTRIAQNDFLPHNVYVYFLCGLIYTWIHESVAELIYMRFFSDVLTYCVMLQAFICYCSSSDVYDVRARACVLFIGIVQLCVNMEKRNRNKIIIIIIITGLVQRHMYVKFSDNVGCISWRGTCS